MSSSREKNTSCLSWRVKEDKLVQFQVHPTLSRVDSCVQTLQRLSMQSYGRKINQPRH